ncbi:ATP-binding cassette domain-containing protein, partial [Streptomyces sp. NRRL S-646]|uniref:ATP-binding cassette domain-containing protein n=1 Tax=Streptomyces sp. NRRL S-646 TaxID=1463917 RepID=UPI0004C8868A
YLSEIFRAAISGVHAGQTEAGEALGLGKAGIFAHVVLPQAVRQALPGTNTMLVDLLKSFDDRLVLDDVNLEVDRGRIVSVIGQSGGGKTTLMRCINLLCGGGCGSKSRPAVPSRHPIG